ncbi:MAG: hypothetical protein ACYDCL_18745 [Myxococcales bacterium]
MKRSPLRLPHAGRTVVPMPLIRPLASVAGALTLSFAPLAAARPLALGLGLPSLALFGQVQPAVPPPPVVLPPGPPLEPGFAPPPEAAVPAPADVLRLRDGRTLQGKILYQVQSGLLFRDEVSRQTYVVPFADIVDVRQGQTTVPAPGAFAPDRRLFLEAQIREVKARYDELSVWPAIEEMIAGALGVGGGVLLFALTGDLIDDVFSAILGVAGLLSLTVGVLELASVVRQENETKDQLQHLEVQLGQLRSENLPVPPPALALRF